MDNGETVKKRERLLSIEEAGPPGIYRIDWKLRDATQFGFWLRFNDRDGGPTIESEEAGPAGAHDGRHSGSRLQNLPFAQRRAR